MFQTTSLIVEPRAGARFKRAFKDLSAGLLSVHAWAALAWHDIKSRYRGSALGPFWISLTLAASMFGIGLLFGDIFNEQAHDFFPYVGFGLGIWMLVSGTIMDSCHTFIAAAPMIKQNNVPISLQAWRVVLRNLIIFAHNLVFLVPLLVWSGHAFNASVHWALVGMVFVTLNLMWMGLFLGVVCARYRDVPQIIASALQMAMFITPVFWRPSALSHTKIIADINPFAHMVEAVRGPLLHAGAPVEAFIYLGVMAIIGWVVALTTFILFRHRIVFYL